MARTKSAYPELLRAKEARRAAGAKKRVALLLRVSDKKQTKDDDVPIPVQRDYCLKLVEKHADEWELSTLEYTEAGVSAFKNTMDDRELLTKAMIDAGADLFDVLVIYKTDRLSRNSEEYPIIIRQFANMGVEIWVYETGMPLKSSSQVDKLLRFVEGWQAETESVNTRIRVTNAMRRMAELGEWTGGKVPYGYRLKDLTPDTLTDETGRSKKRLVRGIEIDPEEAKIVRLMFELYVNQGLGATQVARLINNPPHMARKRNGQPWDGPQIIEVLKNPVYMGRPAWGKNSYQSGQRVRKPSGEWVWSEIHIPDLEIVDEQTWHKTQQLRQDRFGEVMKGKTNLPPRSFTSHLLLTGAAYCGHCGQPLVAKTYSNKRSLADGTVVHDKYEGYMCRNHKRGAKSECPGQKGYWRRDTIEDGVLNLIDQWFQQFVPEQIEAKVMESFQETSTQTAGNYDAIKEEVEGLQKRRAYFTEQLNLAILGKPTRLPLSVIEEQLTEIEREFTAKQAQLSELEKTQSVRMVERETIRQLAEILPNWVSQFRQAQPHHKKFLMNQVVERVIVYDDTMEVTINVRIRSIVESAAAAESELASALEGASTTGPISVHLSKDRGPANVRVSRQNAGSRHQIRRGQLQGHGEGLP